MRIHFSFLNSKASKQTSIHRLNSSEVKRREAIGVQCLFFPFSKRQETASALKKRSPKNRKEKRKQSHRVWSRCRAGWRRGHGRSLPSSERQLCTAWESAWHHTDTTTSKKNELFTFSLDPQKCLMCVVTASELVALNRVVSHHAATEQTLIASLVRLV